MSDSEDSFESADEGDSQLRKESSKKKVYQSANEKLKEPHEKGDLFMKDVKKAGEECVNTEDKSDRKDGTNVGETTETSETVSEASLSNTNKEQTAQPSEIVKSESDETQKNVQKDDKKTAIKNDDDKAAGALEESQSRKSDEDRLTEDKKTDSKKETTETGSTKQLLDKLTDDTNKWGWGSWGSSILQTASESVNTFTSSVGEGFSTVLETVESTLGAPDPSELATQQAELEGKEAPDDKEKKEQQDDPVDPDKGPDSQDITRETGPVGENESNIDLKAAGSSTEEATGKIGWFSKFDVSSLTGVVKQTVQQTSTLVQEKSKGIVHGSLDVLETLGKKTFDVLAEGDHGLKKTIEKAKDRPNLSVVLREAAEKAAETAKIEEEFVESQKSHFGAQFDEFQGLVQLEALEMLSNLCEARLHSLLTAMSAEQVSMVKQELVNIKEAFELGDMEDEGEDEDADHNFPELVTEFTGKLGLNLTAEKLIQVHKNIRDKIAEGASEAKDSDNHNIKAIHQIAIQSLAEVTARTIGHFHRIGQLLLIDPQGPVSAYKNKAAAIASLTKCVCFEVGILSSKSTQSLTSAADSSGETEDVNPLITSVYLEATNSSTYLQDAMLLLLPVVQQAAVESTNV